MWYWIINNMCLYTITSWIGKFPGKNIPWSSSISSEAWSVGHLNPVNKSVKMHLAFNTRALLKQSRSLSNFLAQAVRGCSEDSKLLQWNKNSRFKKRGWSCTFFLELRSSGHKNWKTMGAWVWKKSFFNHFWLSRRKGVYVSCSWPFSDSSVSILWTWHQTPNGPRTFCRPKTLLKSTPGAKKHEHVSPLGAIAAKAWKMMSQADPKQ